jgi:hypothetical protein
MSLSVTIEQRASRREWVCELGGVDTVSEPTLRQSLGHRINKENTPFDVE